MKNILKVSWDQIPDMDPAEESDELRRLMVAKRALLSQFETAHEEEPETLIADMLTDLRHLCDSIGEDFFAADDRARMNYLAEREEEKQ